LKLAAGGFKDTTRVASGRPELWAGILRDNKESVLPALSEYIGVLQGFESALQSGDSDALSSALERAAEVRGSLPKQYAAAPEELYTVRIPMPNKPGVIAEITKAAGAAGCNIQAIDIDHQTEITAVLELVMTGEGKRKAFLQSLEGKGYHPQVE